MVYKNPLLAIDFYKADHRRQYPEGTTEVYSNFTPRSNKHAKLAGIEEDKIVWFGLQGFMRSFLIEKWGREFFASKEYGERQIMQYQSVMDNALGKDSIPVDHLQALNDLGYLPIEIKALPEGSRVPIGVPVLTIKNTKPEFFWLTNYLETIMSAELWKATTSATTAFEYKKILTDYALQTGGDLDFIQFQAHDFSFRGLSGLEDAAKSGAAHLTSFVGTDTVPAIQYVKDYYFAGCSDKLIGCSVPATEHSVMCMGTKEDELGTFKRLITDLYPKGIVSIVSDTWDLWKVLDEFLPQLKETILVREGKVVIRPDSGDPVEIIPKAMQKLWDTFGGTSTSKGYKVLDSHIGLIYGDSITPNRAREILHKLKELGFASTNVVFGVGSYTYQHVTRDTFGFAMKATSGVVNGERRDIFKDPVTDDGTKRSARGLLQVIRTEDGFKLKDRCTPEEEKSGDLQTVFRDGEIIFPITLDRIRQRLDLEIMNLFPNSFKRTLGC